MYVVRQFVTHISFSPFSGIGLAVARRLLEDPERDIRVCLACRNLKKAEDARRSLLLEHPGAQVDLIQLDTSSPRSTTAAAREIYNRYCNHGNLSQAFIPYPIL